MSVRVGVDIDAEVGGFLQGLAQANAASKMFKKEMESNRVQLKSLGKELTEATKNFKKLDSEIGRSGHTARALSLNFYELRTAMRNIASRSIITGFAGITAALASIGVAATAAVGSLANLGAALAISGGAGLVAGLQGIGVAALGLNKIIKAVTTTGEEHEKALDKLTLTARAFAKSLHPVMILFREIKLLSQEGMFPGLTRAMQYLVPLFSDFKQVVYDTAVNMGYLAERAAFMIGNRASLFKKVLENNVRLIQNYGRAFENFGAGMLDMWVAAIPLIDHVAGRVEKFSKTFMKSMDSWRKDGSLGDFFGDLKKSFDNWMTIFGNFAKTFYNVWAASQGAVHLLEKDLAKVFDRMADWTKDHKLDISTYMVRLMEPLRALGGFIGETAKMLVRLSDAGAGVMTHFWNGMTHKLLPIIEELALMLQRDFVSGIGAALSSILDFVNVALPSFELILKPLGLIAQGFSTITDLMKQFVEWGTLHFGKVGGVITTALSVVAITATWIALRTQIQMTLGLLGRGTGAMRNFSAQPARMAVQQGRMAVQGASAYLGARPSSAMNIVPVGRQARSISRNVGRIPTMQQVPIYRMDTRPIYQPRYMPVGDPLLAPRAPAPFVPTRQQMRPGVSMRTSNINPVPRAQPGLQSPIPVTVAKGSLKGTPVNDAMKSYRQSMEGETKKGFLSGLKSIKGSAAVGAIGALAGSVGLALAIPVGIAAVGAIAKALKDNRPKIQKEIDKFIAPNTGRASVIHYRGERAGVAAIDDPIVAPLQNLNTQLGPAIKSLDATKIRGIAGAMAELARKTKDVGEANKLKDLAQDVQNLASKASSALLEKLSPDFDTFGSATKDSIDHVLDALSVLQVQITSKLPVGSREYKEAMASSFGQAADAIQEAMDQGVISTDKGLKKIKSLVYKQFTELGFTPQQARHLADPKNKTADPTGKQGGSENPGGMPIAGRARGGFVGGKGLVGKDSVPMNFNGQPVVTAPGEYIGVFTRHQQRAFESKTGMPMPDFFEKNKTPHYAAKGGTFDSGGNQLQLPSSFKPTHQTAGLANFPAIDVFAQPGTRVLSPASGTVSKLSGQAGGPGGGGAYGYSMYVSSGKKTYFLTHFGSRSKGLGDKVSYGEGIGTVADYPGGIPDHIHEGLNAAGLKLSGDSTTGGMTVTPIDTPNVKNQGLIGGLVKAGLASATGVANAALSKAAASIGSTFANMADPKLGDGNILGGGGSAANQSLAKAMLSKFGWGTSEWPSMQALGKGESDWDETATNTSSGAFGIGQFLGGTKTAYAKYGATSSKAGPQINAMMQYIKDRYGSPTNAYSTWLSRSPHWYSAGGVEPPDPTGNKMPTVDPDDAITPGSHKPSKKKKKKKKKVRIAGGRPTLGAGVGANKFKPSSKKPKSKPRNKITAMVERAFGVSDPFQVDALTGESIGIDNYPPLLSITGYENRISSAGDMLDSLSNTAGLTDEQAIVTLYDSDNFPDLSNYLASIGEDPAAWIDKFGDSADVVNTSGMNVQGVYTRGISQAVAEMMTELAVHEGPLSNGTPIMQALGIISGTAGSIPSQRAIDERLKRLAEVKKVFEANVALRKSYARKMKKMKSGSYTWQEAVAHNTDLVSDWRRWKRDSINEPQADTDTANHEIDRLTDLNKELKKKKPKGTVYGSAEYQRTLSIYQGRGIENRMLVGDKDAEQWSPGSMSGYAGGVLDSVSAWRDLDHTKSQIMSDMPGRISSEQSNIASIKANIKDWTGTTVPPRPVDRTKPENDGKADKLAELDKLDRMDKLRSALLGNTQFDVLSSFAQIMGMRVLGAYAHGGLIPETGMALVHKGEYITPSPDGPFRNGMNAPSAGSNNFHVEVHMRDKAGSLVELVDARVRQVAPAEVSRASGRNTRRLQASPGRRRT